MTCSLIVLLCQVSWGQALTDRIDFNRDIRPILSSKCYSCHGPDDEHREAGLRLDQSEFATAAAESGEIAIAPGDIESSALLARVTSADDDVRMPPSDTDSPLTASEIAKLKQWIREGALYESHWSFVPPAFAPWSNAIDPDVRSPIDFWIRQKLQAFKLSPSEPSEPHSLIRRLSLDLCGLPPTIAESEHFVAEERPDAVPRAVDRLLASPAYGERWTRVWLDVARYADSSGYASDPLRPNMWPYREWVIHALNANKPFDVFTVEQLAGDLLERPSEDQLIATAFHRNTMTNTEGGTDDEEFRVAAVKDRAITTLQAWMGLTVGCAQCHNHKYDPISQKEFYQLYAIFNQSADTDQPDERPTMPIYTSAMRDQIERIEQEIARLRDSVQVSSADLAQEQSDWEASLKMKSDWAVVSGADLHAEGGSVLRTLEDNSILASGQSASPEIYTAETTIDKSAFTSLRLEALPDPSLPNGGPGRAGDGNFVLSRIAVEAVDADQANQRQQGRYVRIDLPGKDKILSLAEVVVASGEENVAREGKARQSSTAFDGAAERAIDGITSGEYFAANSVTHTDHQSDPWWEVDLGRLEEIDRITIWNRTDNGLEDRLQGATVRVLDADRKEVWAVTMDQPPRPKSDLAVSRWRSVEIASSSATYSQAGFPVANAVAQPDLTKSGWAVGPKYNASQTAWFAFRSPTIAAKSTRVRIRLEYHYAQPNYSLGRFRLALSDDPAAIKRAPVPADLLATVDKPAEERTDVEREKLGAYYRSVSPRLEPIRQQITELEKSKPSPVPLPVMRELSQNRRKTALMVKGNFLTPGEYVEPAIPEMFSGIGTPVSNRLELARWLVSPSNPLTARVTVNRLWARLFGRGIVETEEDFGTQGELPTHRELLDWLAVEFQSDWDMKRLLRELVTSATYCQTSKVTGERHEKDPANIYLSRAPRQRLDAETVRDQALALSGLLSTKLAGPSVFPYQTPGLWQAAFNGDRLWPTSAREDRFRRGLYTFWRRTIPYPSMSTFDAPSREICTFRRPNTNTPLQAFVTLNDPAYVEMAQALAYRLMHEGGATPLERIRFGLTLCLGRPADQQAIDALAHLYESEMEHYTAHADLAQTMIADSKDVLPAGVDPMETAAWTVIANVLLNLDGVLTRG